MAFEADCGSSTVLEEINVTRTVRFLFPGERWVSTAVLCAAISLFFVPFARAPREEPNRGQPARIHTAVSRAVKFEIRNSKFEISRVWMAGIPNS